MAYNRKNVPAKRKWAGGGQISFVTPVFEACSALQNAEHARFVTNLGFQKFVSLPWADDSVCHEEMLDLIRGYDPLTYTSRIAGRDVDLSSEALDRNFGLSGGNRRVEQRVHNFVSKSFSESARKTYSCNLSLGDRVTVERLQFLRTAIHVMNARPNVPNAWVKQVEDLTISRKWSDYFADRFQ